MKKHTNLSIGLVFLILSLSAAVGCKKQAPVAPSAQEATPAASKQNPTENQPVKNTPPAKDPKQDNPAPQTQHAGVHWFTDYEQARAKAVKENKDLLINFSGSDWCGFCIKLEKDVFSQAAFAQEAEKYFVFMLVDFPSNPASQSPELRKQNELLARIYPFKNYFPMIFLAGPDGKPYAEAEYKEGGPQVYLDYLLRIRQYKNQ